jgi:hypothetical protein
MLYQAYHLIGALRRMQRQPFAEQRLPLNETINA